MAARCRDILREGEAECFDYARDPMHEKIACDAARVVPVTAPAEEPVGLPRAFRCGPEEGFPIQVLARPRVGIDVIEEEILQVVPRIVDLREDNLSQAAILYVF